MVGQVFLKQYVVTAALGQGSMGRIFLARDRLSGRDVVLKLMKPELAAQPKFREQFQQELDVMRRLRHPYAVALLDGSLDDPNGPCLVMEHVRGEDLETLRRRQPQRRFSPTRIARVVGQLCEVLQAAHDQGVVHRDLKPSNLMVVDWGKPLERIKVMDFGLAQWSDDASSPGRGGAAGYVCPELILDHPADHRGDIYSVGVILFELLTGQMPFRRPSVEEAIQAHLKEMPPRFADIDPALNVPAGVEAVVQTCLAKEPAGRPGSAIDLGRRLERALDQKILGEAADLPEPAGLAEPAPTVYRAKPTMPGTISVPRPTRPTMQGTRPVETDEVTCNIDGFHPDAEAQERLAGFVRDVGGRLVERSAETLRALLPINLGAAASSLTEGGSGSGNVQLVLTELEARWLARDLEQPLRLTFRPLGPVSVSLSPGWRRGCERLHGQLQTYLKG